VIKGLQRAVGSLFGGVLCFALVAVLPEHFWFGYLLPLLAFVGIGFTMTNYTWMAIAITPLVVIGFGNTDMHYEVLAARILYTAAGCLLAVLVRVVLWPSWKRDELPEIAARALTAQSAFFEQLKQSLTIEAPSPEKARALLDSGRAARIALDGLAEAQRHMLTEPLSAAGHEIDAMVPLIEDLRRMSFSLVVHAHQAGDDQRERTIANIEVIENALAQASQRIEQIAGEGETQTSPIFDFRPSRSETARERIARVEAEIASLAPIARFIRERVDALKLDPITA
jgi:uncharacterized membrane protein YccC